MAEQTNTLLVPLDGSKNAEAAIPVAAQVARALHAHLRYLYVADPDSVKVKGSLERAGETFTTYVEGHLKRIKAADVPHTTQVIKGQAAQVILREAKSTMGVVLATHGRSGLKATMVGSVADKVVRGAATPTLAVPLGFTGVLKGPLVVGLDGSETAEKGLNLARELATALGTTVVLARSWTIPPPVGVEFVAYPVDLSDTQQKAAEEYLTKTAKPGEKTYCVMGHPVDALDEVARKTKAGAVVLTSHGKGFAARLALGSTTDGALHHIERPVLVVPGK